MKLAKLLIVALGCFSAAAVAEDAYMVVTGKLVKSTDPANLNCDGIPTQTHMGGVASCPAGYVATGGSVNCQVPPTGGIMLTSRLVQPSDANGNVFQWVADCCVDKNVQAEFESVTIMCVKASKFSN